MESTFGVRASPCQSLVQTITWGNVLRSSRTQTFCMRSVFFKVTLARWLQFISCVVDKLLGICFVELRANHLPAQWCLKGAGVYFPRVGVLLFVRLWLLLSSGLMLPRPAKRKSASFEKLIWAKQCFHRMKNSMSRLVRAFQYRKIIDLNQLCKTIFLCLWNPTCFLLCILY